jgi:glycosyltransferase involved in cell wall biosynthesis
MRILMLNNEFPPLGGGTGTVNEAVLRRFAAEPDIWVDLVTSALGSHGETVEFAPRIRLCKTPVRNRNIHHSSNRELAAYAFGGLSTALRLHRNAPYDVCLAWSAVPAGGVAAAMRRLTELPYVVRVSGPDIPGFEARYRALYPVLTPLIKSTWRGAELVIAKCMDERAAIHAADPTARVAIVPNGVDLDRFWPGPPIPDAGPLRLLCVGRLIERKGQADLIAALKQLTDAGLDVTLSLVGTGDSEPAYRRLAAESGVAKRVEFAGYVPREEVPVQYAAAHVFELPSYNEGMSVATLEALAAGLPLVVSRTGGTADLVVEGVNGRTFAPGDVQTLAKHLRELALDRGAARRMGAASRERAAQFSWETTSRLCLDVLRQAQDRAH